jgi:hypothetical protein
MGERVLDAAQISRYGATFSGRSTGFNRHLSTLISPAEGKCSVRQNRNHVHIVQNRGQHSVDPSRESADPTLVSGIADYGRRNSAGQEVAKSWPGRGL